MTDLSAGHIVVIGTGLAALYSAVLMAPLPVLIVARGAFDMDSSSIWAQGGVAASVGAQDNAEFHLRDTVYVGGGLVNEDAARKVVYDAASCVSDLEKMGVHFDRDDEGNLRLGLEGGHSFPRVMHARGDATGAAIMSCMINHARHNHINTLYPYIALDLEVVDNSVIGIWVARACGAGMLSYRDPFFIPVRALVIAGGGVGALYNTTTNPLYTCGSTMGMALRAGMQVSDAEFVQFHPTSLKSEKAPAILITEAVRGAGAVLVDQEGCPIIDIQDGVVPARDLVVRALSSARSQGRQAFLDMRKIPKEQFTSYFVGAYNTCINYGLDPMKDLIPVQPAAHYHMGGIVTDVTGCSSMNNVWVCGEAATTGMHGANRLASNSILEILSVGKEVAGNIKGFTNSADVYSGMPDTRIRKDQIDSFTDDRLYTDVLCELRDIMSGYVGVERCEDGLKKAINKISSMASSTSNIAMLNVLMAAKAIAVSSFMRRESRGCHYRTDFPVADETMCKHIVLNKRIIDACLA